MFKIKKILSVVMLALMIFSLTALPAFSQARHGIQVTGGHMASTDLILPAGTWVYGMKIHADAANSWATIYNSATYVAGGLDITTWVDEVGEATQYDSDVSWLPEPVYCGNGVSIEMSTGVAYVYYGPEPSTR